MSESRRILHKTLMFSRYQPTSSNDNEQTSDSVDRFLRVHNTSAKGRPIPTILYDRSLGGRNAVHGVKWGRKDSRRQQQNCQDQTTINTFRPEHAASTNMTTDRSATGHNIQNESPASSNSVFDFPSTATTTQSSRSSAQQAARAHLNSGPCKITNEIRNFGELYSITKFQTSYLLGRGERGGGTQASTTAAVSTISVAFSTDGEVLASTHGDHTVKITCCHSGRLLRNMHGHSRTPWTVKFHPSNKYIVASGCLGYQVRVWDWSLRGDCGLNLIRLQYAIISLAFHPTGKLLAVASGNSLYLWDYNNQHQNMESSNETSDKVTTSNNNISRRNRGMGVLIEIRHEHALRCVHFPPGGNTIIVGGVNPTSEGGIGGMIFSLKLWDFDMTAIWRRPIITRESRSEIRTGEALSNPCTFINRALLYNDGGFDVSPCGKFLCACAEYWLPEGVKCATDLATPDDYDYDDGYDGMDTSERISTSSQLDDVNDLSSAMDIDEDPKPKLTPKNRTSELSHSMTTIGEMNTKSNNKFQLNTEGRSAQSTHSSKLFATPPRSNNTNQVNQNQSSSSTPSSHNSTQMQNNKNSQQLQQQQTNSHPVILPSQYPLTPPAQTHQAIPLSPPSPPGRRLIGGLSSHRHSGISSSERSGHPISPGSSFVEGRFVPHVVTVSMEPNNLGKLLEAAPLDGAKASGVTCVKFSPSAEFCLLGYGVRENVSTRSQQHQHEPAHPVTALYRIRGGMTHVSTMMSQDDDVNIARFHPHSGHGFVYGTKQGRVRILSPKPWNYLCNVKMLSMDGK